MNSGTDLPITRCFSSAIIRVMYLKKHKRKKNGKYNTYFSIVEKRKASRGRYVEKMVVGVKNASFDLQVRNLG